MDARVADRSPTPAAVSPLPVAQPETGTDALWQEVADCQDATRREELLSELIVAHLDLARALARRYHRRGEESEDLEQVAFVGLTKAVRGFEPGRGVGFASYAVPTILGEIKRHFRDSCWSVRPPRRVQELQARLATVAADLQHRLHRTPTTAELATELGVTLEELHEARASVGCFSAQSLDGLAEPDRDGERLGVDDPRFDRLENVMLLAPVLSELADRERRILGHRFVDEWSQQQIATELGVTQMQVSRLLRRVLGRMRTQLALDPALPQAS